MAQPSSWGRNVMEWLDAYSIFVFCAFCVPTRSSPFLWTRTDAGDGRIQYLQVVYDRLLGVILMMVQPSSWDRNAMPRPPVHTLCTLPACKDPTAYGRDILAVVASPGGLALGFLPCRFLPFACLRVPVLFSGLGLMLATAASNTFKSSMTGCWASY